MRERMLSIPTEAYVLVAERFKTLGKPLRLQILQILRHRRLSVAQITAAVRSTQPNVSKHLKALQDEGILGRSQDGTTVHYWVIDKQVLQVMDSVWKNLRQHVQTRAKTLDGWKQR